VFEANAYQALGPIHPMDPVQIEWGFAPIELSINLWQKEQRGPFGPSGSIRVVSKVLKKGIQLGKRAYL